MLLDEIANRLVAEGVGAINSVIFMGAKAIIPSGDGPYLTLSETGGFSPAGTQNDTGTERPTVQILGRATSYPIARAKVQQAFDALGGANGLHNMLLSGVWYVSIKARQSVTDMMQQDEQGRAMLVFNIDAEKSPS